VPNHGVVRSWLAYVGLIEVIFFSSLLFTHSLLMKRPVGCVYFLPFGAVSSIERPDIFLVKLNDLEKVVLSLIALYVEDGRSGREIDK
jgi:hypothetical protein